MLVLSSSQHRHRHTQRHRDTDRHTQTQTHRHRHTDTHTHTHTHTSAHARVRTHYSVKFTSLIIATQDAPNVLDLEYLLLALVNHLTDNCMSKMNVSCSRATRGSYSDIVDKMLKVLLCKSFAITKINSH